jgi:chromosome segregation ATPase
MNFDCNSLEQRNQHLEGRLRELEAELQEGNKDRVREMERDREDMRREVARIGGRLQDAQQELERLAEYSRSLEQAVEKYKEDKEFVYRQLREEVSRSGALAK